MARITVEDCAPVVKNRFELSVLAGYRAKEISKGAPVSIVKHDNDKNTVTSLREIAEQGVEIEDLRNSYVLSMQKKAHADDLPEEETQNVAAELQDSDNDSSDDDADMTSTTESQEDASPEDYISVDDYTFEDENDLDD